jgi:hypothetical protein
MTANLGQNFISNTDWMIKRDLVNMKHELIQMKKELSETLQRFPSPTSSKPSPGASSSPPRAEDPMTMVKRMKYEEGSQSNPKPLTPLSLDAIRQSNLQNRDTYYLSQLNAGSKSEESSGNGNKEASSNLSTPLLNEEESDSKSSSITLSSGLTIPSVRLDKTNILLLGPTGFLSLASLPPPPPLSFPVPSPSSSKERTP